MTDKAVFLDRDGVINELIYHREAGVIDSPFTVNQFKLLPGVADAIHILNDAGYKVIVVSNQPGVAKGHFSIDILNETTRKMHLLLKQQRAFLDRVYYCLHHPESKMEKYRVQCNCRKPEPGLLMQAATDFKLSLEKCYMVGDSLTDILAGQRAGCPTVLIGNYKCQMCKHCDETGIRPDYIAGDLQSAVNMILK
jgi:D,D-heptose 1,7-bisphosphate phosphatase